MSNTPCVRKTRAGPRLRAAFAVLLAPLCTVAPAAAQEAPVVQGRVTASTGEPLSGVQVSIPAYDAGALTGEDGAYSVTVPAARVGPETVLIQARLIGFRTREAEITLRPGAQVTQDFQMEVDPIRLDEIVATGQGTQQERRRLGNAVNTVTSESIEASQENNLVAALAGKAPNVEVTASGGEPGAGAFIRIRGSNTLSGSNEPLFVVDGTPISNRSSAIEGVAADNTVNAVAGTVYQNRGADINPNDIASLEILKGPAASAIYGAAGANGAVLITTKGGARNAPTQVTLETSYSIDEVTELVPLQREFGRGLANPDNPSENLAPTATQSWGPRLACAPNCVLGRDVFDHGEELFDTGYRIDTNLSVAGGSNRTTWYLSGGFLHHAGVIVGNSEQDKLTTRLKGSHMVLDNLTLSGNFAYSQQNGDLVQQGSNISGLLLGGYRTPPEFNNLPYLDPVSGLHRSYRNPNPTSLASGRGYDNPFFIANEIQNTTDVDRTFGNVRADWDPLSWLNLQYTLGADYYNDARFTLFPKSSSDFPQGRIVRADLSEFIVDHSLLLTGTRELTEDIAGSLTLGQNLRHEEFSRYQVNGQNLIFGAEELDFTVDRIPDEFRSEVRTEGYFATADVDLYDQLFLTGGLRLDASSTFGGEDVERFLYPKASAAWEFTRLPSFRDVGWLDYGKLRVAYGVAGKAPPVFSNVSAFTTGTFTDGWLTPNGLESIYGGNEGAFTETAQGNEDIEPEETTEWEAGADLAFWDSRLALGATYYHQKTVDAILDLPVAPSTGFFTKPQNGAEFENRGWELTLDVAPVRMDGFRWEIGAQWAKNDSEVLELLGAEEFFLAGFTGSAISVVGGVQPDGSPGICGPTGREACPFGVIFGDDFVRFGRGTLVDEQNIDELFPNARPGDIYIAADGLPLYDAQARHIGDPNPDWTGSVRNTFTLFDNLRISGLIDVKHGGDMWNGTKGALFSFGTHAFTAPMHEAGIAHVFGCGAEEAGTGPAMGEFGTCSDPRGVAGPGAGQEVVLNWDTWAVNNIGGGFSGPSSQFVEDAGFVKLRDVSVSYTFDQPWVRTVGGASRIEVAAAGRNLKTWTDYTGQDPESNLTGQSTGRGLDYFHNPQSRSFVFTLSIVR